MRRSASVNADATVYGSTCASAFGDGGSLSSSGPARAARLERRGPRRTRRTTTGGSNGRSGGASISMGVPSRLQYVPTTLCVCSPAMMSSPLLAKIDISLWLLSISVARGNPQLRRWVSASRANDQIAESVQLTRGYALSGAACCNSRLFVRVDKLRPEMPRQPLGAPRCLRPRSRPSATQIRN